MKETPNFRFTPGVLGYPLMFVLAIWIVFWIEVRFNINLNKFGVYPGTVKGLRGIIFSPFIHSGIKHLFNNTIPLLLLSMAMFYFYRDIAWKAIGWGVLLCGVLTWIIARPAYHIGASGVVYLLASFLFFKGIFSKYYRLVALSLAVVFLYGGLLWYLTPIDPEISWEGHLSGFLTGFGFAFLFKEKIPKTPKYDWEKPGFKEEDDEFMKHFDKEGNFIEKLPEAPTLQDDYHVRDTNINYIYKPKEEE